MLYNCFPFFNELELLEVRLEELSPIVDRFVLVEATQTHTGDPKWLFYENYKNDFKKFHDKIIHIVIQEFPPNLTTADARDQFHKNTTAELPCESDDMILISDADEIFRCDAIADYVKTKQFCTLDLTQYYYWLNCKAAFPWHTCKLVPYQILKDGQTAWTIRSAEAPITVPNAGWHFSWLGGVERIKQKLKSFAHTEFAHGKYLDDTYINECLNKGRYLLDPPFDLEFVSIDETYPRFIRENLEKFKSFIKAS